jgi:radical SAM superfamily enzyme YgiQ (UPF0313 family)
MRILLVQPPLDPTTSKLSALGIPEPLGIEYVAAAVPEHETRIVDLRIGGSLIEEIERFDPEMVATTALTASVPRALELLKTAKRMDSKMITVIGGHHPTLRPLDCQNDAVDVVVRGDGECPFAELVSRLSSHKSLDAVAGISYREDGRWRTNPPAPLCHLDDYSFPARHLTEHARYAYFRVGLGPIVTAISSRGCTHRCHFCSIWRFHGGRYRKRSPASVVAELSRTTEKAVDLVDDDSFADLLHMERLGELVASELPGRIFRFLVRSDAVLRAPALFGRWAEIGLKYALVGLESFRDDELRDMNKRATAEQNVKALEILKDAGIRVIGYLLVRPDYHVDDFARLADAVETLGIAQPVFATMTPFPGTVLYEQMKDRLVTDDWEHFDGFRAVVETALPRSDYYHNLANLYRRAYSVQPAPTGGEGLPWYEKLARAIEGIECETPA